MISSIDEPEPGWIDNFNGPMAMLIAGGKGVIRVSYSRAEVISDYIPVDTTVKAMVVAAWKRGIKPYVLNSLSIL